MSPSSPISALTSAILLTTSVLYSHISEAKFSHTKLFLVGGGLKTCSSMSPNQCQSSATFEKADVKQTAYYQVSADNIDLLFSHWPEDHLLTQREELSKLLKRMANKSANNPLNRNQLRSLWRKYDTSKVINKLADKEYYMMLDALEVAQFSDTHQNSGQSDNRNRLKEEVSLSNTKNPFSIEVFSRFRELAHLKMESKTSVNTSAVQAESKSLSNENTSRKPNILVVTASARDPFEAVDFYTQVFAQTDANVTWLPIDAALNRLWQEKGNSAEACQELPAYQARILGTINRSSVYSDLVDYQKNLCAQPEKLIELIQTADGIFINGGDQSLTTQAFKNIDHSDSLLLAAIRSQLTSNQLVVGGTSAGTAVMSGNYDSVFSGTSVTKTKATRAIPMITNGRSEVALVRGAKADQLPNAGCQKASQCNDDLINDDLTYNSKGGIGLFSFGIMDTHFSERGREGRLAKLLVDTQAPFAFGVDEATALEVSWQSPESDVSDKHPKNVEQVSMKVVGQSGVYVIENSFNKNRSENKVLTHYLTRDDTASLMPKSNVLNITFAPWKVSAAPLNIELPTIKEKLFEGETFKLFAKALCYSDQKQVNAESRWNNAVTPISLTKKSNWQHGIGKVKLADTSKDYCSYKNLALDFSK
ncbi:MAG: hypothetical protein CL811_08855 [Colwelliaceae bacterium]|nr:hypothetical protein [Colwelliaceae bacterium]